MSSISLHASRRCSPLWRALAALLALLALAGCARGSRPAALAATTVETLTSGGQQRAYRLHLPPAAGAGQPLPLVINLHGFNSNAEQQERVSQMSAKADAAGFVVAYPEGLGSPQSWRFGPGAEAAADVQFIRDVTQAIQARQPIDPRRIYVTGISNGAELSYRLICDFADTAAAFALVSGGYPPFPECRPARPVPVVLFHGTADNLLAYAGRPPLMLPVRDWAAQWAARNRCAADPKVILKREEVTAEAWLGCQAGADVELYTIAGKGHSWPGSDMPARITTRAISATDIMWDFFVAHPLPGA
jgi:polyhydroxybutyrate depolymerase